MIERVREQTGARDATDFRRPGHNAGLHHLSVRADAGGTARPEFRDNELLALPFRRQSDAKPAEDPK